MALRCDIAALANLPSRPAWVLRASGQLISISNRFKGEAMTDRDCDCTSAEDCDGSCKKEK